MTIMNKTNGIYSAIVVIILLMPVCLSVSGLTVTKRPGEM